MDLLALLANKPLSFKTTFLIEAGLSDSWLSDYLTKMIVVDENAFFLNETSNYQVS